MKRAGNIALVLLVFLAPIVFVKYCEQALYYPDVWAKSSTFENIVGVAIAVFFMLLAWLAAACFSYLFFLLVRVASRVVVKAIGMQDTAAFGFLFDEGSDKQWSEVTSIICVFAPALVYWARFVYDCYMILK